MLTSITLQGMPGNIWILLALLLVVCLLLVALLLLLLRSSKQAVTTSNEQPGLRDYALPATPSPPQKVWQMQGSQQQTYDTPELDAQVPPVQNGQPDQPLPASSSPADASGSASGLRQELQPLAAQGRCPLCGKVVQPTDTFCMNCGNRLKPASAQSSSGKRPVVQSAPSLSPAVLLTPPPSNDRSLLASPERAPRDPAPLPPRQAGEGKLVAHLVLRSGNTVLREYPLLSSETSIGRSANNDILLSRDKLTSRHHAIIRYERGRYLLLDQHSANGTYLNGRKIITVAAHPLSDGDIIGIGVNEFVFHLSPSADLPTVALPAEAAAQEAKRSHVEEPLQNMVTDVHAPLVESQPVPSTPTSDDARNAISSQHPRFTAFHPKDVPANIWNTLLVYAHQDATMEAVYQDADRFRQELEDIPAGSSTPLEQPLFSAAKITIVPECQGVVFNPRRVSFSWSENWHRAMFRFSIREELLAAGIAGRINIFAGPLLIATLEMAMMPTGQAQPEQISGAEATARPYTRIFASYSDRDSALVQAYRDVARALGIAVRQQEAQGAREGLSDPVKRAIEEAEVFQLFWSAHAARSAAVRQEWEYALRLQRGENFLRPVYWDVPLIAPPSELAAVRFTYLPSYTFL